MWIYDFFCEDQSTTPNSKMGPRKGTILLALVVVCLSIQESAAGWFNKEIDFHGTCDQTHPCSQICIQEPGNMVRCECFPGNVLAPNGALCLGETIDIDSDVPTTTGLLTDDEDLIQGSGSGVDPTDEEPDSPSSPHFTQPAPTTRPSRPTQGPPTDQVEELTCAEWPCENGGSCFMKGDTPMCTCLLGWEGAMCEDAVKIRFPRFYGNSYLSLPAPTARMYESFYVTISFKPAAPTGRFLFASQGLDGQGDYMAIGLLDGKAIFRFDCGQGAAVIVSRSIVTLHSWNTLKVGRKLRHGWLQLNDGPVIKGSSPGAYSKVTLKGDLYIGGFNESDEVRDGLRMKHMFHGFTGCIESIEISDVDLDLRPSPRGSITNGQNIGECSEGVCQHHVCTNGGSCVSRSADQAMCLCPLGTHGMVCEDLIEIHTPSFNSTHSSHIAHDSLGNNHLSFLQMEVIFKPREPSGILIYSGSDSSEGDFFSITIDDRFINFKFDCGSGPAVLRSTQQVTLHEWHIIEVSRTAREGMLKVDNQPTVQAFAPGAFTQTSFDTSLYIGGVDDIDLLSKNVAVRNSFTGDIQRILVNDDPLDLIQEALGGANVGNADHPCQGQPCLNNGECHPLHDGYLCDCRLGYKGSNCEQEVEEEVVVPHFNGRSFMWFVSNEVTSRLTGERNIFTFELQSDEPNGLILWAGHSSMTSGSDFISIGLEHGFLVLHFNLGGGEAQLSSRRPVSDGEWHTVKIDRLGTVGIMEIDNDDAVTADSEGVNFRQLNVNHGLYLGGMPEIVDTTMNRYTTGMTGCLRNLKINENYQVTSSRLADDGRNIDHCS